MSERLARIGIAAMKGEPMPEFDGCTEHDRCKERDKAECEWCMREADDE